MKPDRLNAFTDGVIAIIITIMVLELRVPAAGGFEAIKPVLPLLAVYAASFVNVGIFWSNHHHMMQSVGNGGVLWANLALLFWLSLIPFVIRWIDEASMTSWPVAAYGIVLVAAAIAYIILERTLIAAEGDDSKLSLAVGSKLKEWASFACYSAGIAAAFLVSPYVSIALYLTVSAIWLVPDRRFERSL